MNRHLVKLEAPPAGCNEEVPLAKIAHLTPQFIYKKKIQRKKRAFDICFSLIIMTLGSPFFFLIFIITKLSSPGPIFFKQVRLGENCRTFHIYKFRSMYCDAEVAGPQLSRAGDPRITKWGRIIRKTRLDELPQFWNVLKGEMSIVGPRPEREHFARQILELRPDYITVQKLRPGITSLGQVNFGYAENVGQMCERLDHDLLYVKKLSLRTDLIVIAKTVGVMIKGRGK
ncbi:sugar transferase [Mucilaginibacter myungsuensis]|uniref:Sugar transferase n=2 Tax=Mucilaginibacter myungsuensis TaxID=649104 RepID=A0A929L498_9SPHI|nr:sugar transferase [Mucilaginibacter myungsuensis]